MPKNRVRLTIEMPMKSRTYLEELKEKTGEASLSAVMVKALTLYGWLKENDRLGGYLRIENCAGEITAALPLSIV